MFETSTKSTNVAGGLSFKFDIIIVQLKLTSVNVEENSKIEIDVKFNNNNIKITASRINVNEFTPGHSFEFNERLSVLKDKLIKNPLECHVYYDSQSVGTCTFLWPDSFINCIAEGCGRELTHFDEAYIEKDVQKVGRLEIIARLQIICHEFEEELILNPKDVLFAVDETKYGSICCSDVDVISASECGRSGLATCLDLSELRHIHGKTVKSTDILNYIGAKCCKTKNSSNQCKEMIKNLFEKSNGSPSCVKICSKQSLYQLLSERQMKPRDCISDSKLSFSSSTDSHQPYYCISDENVSEDRKGVKENPTRKYCPLCHENITWLPKFAACPKCGFRPFSYNIEEKPYDHKLTANKILQEYINGNVMRQASDISMKNSQQTDPCRCTCKNEKICAHCRIKKFCEDILQPTQKSGEDCGKCETKSSDLYNICKTNSRTCRPYLTKVFEELQDLFNMNEIKKKNAFSSNELNNISKNIEEINSSNFHVNQPKDVNKTTKEVQKSHQSTEKKLHEERTQLSLKNIQKRESSKSKSYDYNKQRKYSGTKMGHKTCLAGLKIVPRNMGWLWNAETNGSRTGWMPGAIRKPIKNLMQHFLNKDKLYCSSGWQIDEGGHKIHSEEKDYTKEPTLHICKKDGVYYITLRPLKEYDTHLNMKPIQFKISKNPILVELRKIKQHLKEMGFAKCICHRPISNCCCRSFLEKKKLEYQCCKECHKRKLPNCSDNLILSDTTDSEAEFEFGVTPPAGELQTGTCLKKRKKVSSATQYEKGDWKIKQKYPKPLGKYLKLHNCAVGNRFGEVFGPYGIKGYSPGAVAVDGIYGPHGIISTRMHRKGGKGIIKRGSEAFRGPDGKFSMAQYLAYKALTKPTAEEIAEKKRQKMKLLKGVNPPLLCKVERRGKPIDICSAYSPIPCNVACLSDDRIC